MPVKFEEMENVCGGAEPIILEQNVVYYDENGHKYTITIKSQEAKMPEIIGQKVTYSDGNGTTFTVEQ